MLIDDSDSLNQNPSVFILIITTYTVMIEF